MMASTYFKQFGRGSVIVLLLLGQSVSGKVDLSSHLHPKDGVQESSLEIWFQSLPARGTMYSTASNHELPDKQEVNRNTIDDSDDAEGQLSGRTSPSLLTSSGSDLHKSSRIDYQGTMMDATKDILSELGMPEANIKTEAFGGASPKKTATKISNNGHK